MARIIRPRNFLATLTVTAGLLLAGCAFFNGTDGKEDLSDISWLLLELSGSPVVSPPVMTLNFTEHGNVSGSDGCNRYSSTYTAEDGAINISEEITTTKAACPGPIMWRASAFITALKQAAAYRQEKGQLTLLTADGTASAVFVRQSQELRRTSWEVTGYNNGQGIIVGVISGSRKLTANFAVDGKVSGASGCNSYSGDYTYTSADRSLRFGRTRSTLKACSDRSIMQQEQSFMTALENVRSYYIEGDTLTLKAADGRVAVTFAGKVSPAVKVK
ncbi:MAG: META domain-containing protein [Candidatus Electrothrix sp. YB6]